MTKLKYIVVIFYTLLFINNSISQSSDRDSVLANYLLVNSSKKSKKIQIRDVSTYAITYVEKIYDSISTEKIYYISGNIRQLNENSIDFDIKNESIEHNFKDGSTINSSNDYSSFYYSENQKPRTIELKNILYFDYSSPKRNLIHSIGVSSMIVSASIALVVGPLLAVNYTKKVEGQTKSFNFSQSKNFSIKESTYFDCAKFGLIGFTLGYPVARSTRSKRFNITENKNKNEKNYWYFEEQEVNK